MRIESYTVYPGRKECHVHVTGIEASTPFSTRQEEAVLVLSEDGDLAGKVDYTDADVADALEAKEGVRVELAAAEAIVEPAREEG